MFRLQLASKFPKQHVGTFICYVIILVVLHIGVSFAEPVRYNSADVLILGCEMVTELGPRFKIAGGSLGRMLGHHVKETERPLPCYSLHAQDINMEFGTDTLAAQHRCGDVEEETLKNFRKSNQHLPVEKRHMIWRIAFFERVGK